MFTGGEKQLWFLIFYIIINYYYSLLSKYICNSIVIYGKNIFILIYKSASRYVYCICLVF